MKTRASHRIATEEPVYALSLAANPEFDTTTLRFTYQSLVTPSSVFDYDMDDAAAHAAEAAGGARRVRSGAATKRSASGRPRATARRCRSRSSTGRASRSTAARRCCCTATARTASRMSPTFSSTRLEPARPRLRLRDRPHPRRRRAGRGVARAGTDDAEDEHVHRLHRLRRVPGRRTGTRRRTGS